MSNAHRCCLPMTHSQSEFGNIISLFENIGKEEIMQNENNGKDKKDLPPKKKRSKK